MKIKRFIIKSGLLLSVSLFFSCAGIYYGPAIKEPGPVVRVGILENRSELAVEPQGAFVIAAKEGRLYRISDKDLWRISIISSTPAEYAYKIVLSQFNDVKNAEKALQDAVGNNLDAELYINGDYLVLEGDILIDRRIYRVLLKHNFTDEQEARTFLENSPGLVSARIIKLKVKDAEGKIQLTSSRGKNIVIRNALRISGSLITLRDIEVGTGFHFSRKEDRSYKGEIEIMFGDTGNLYAINVLTLESYLEGVLPGEMLSTFPLEALKAQAIAARTFFLYNFGRRYRDALYDVTDDVRSQVFIGAGKRDKKIETAVRQTRGLVLTYNGKLCSTPYSAICGGHTEFAENVWEGEGEPYLQGVLDELSSKSLPESFDLSQEENVAKWVNSTPKVNCNVKEYDTPKFVSYSTKYFRWEQRYSRPELEGIIRQKTGHDIGSLIDIVPLERGVSGRLIEVKILGTMDSFTIRKELNIRQAFSKSTLYSACFVVEKIGGSNGLADEFVFKGAGWGHGVGMCQVGAAMMAFNHRKFAQILYHYYRGAKVDRFY
ncbi:SpoIID/LytB domain-containing protein [candidate division KSB1 bacterium]|nr:SpoIID/LytB domain-containing protein [candidate division KSB1 bacterium]